MIIYEILSKIGDRSVNEDYVGTYELTSNHIGFCVCDGLGGHGHGDIASNISAHVFAKIFAGSNNTKKPEHPESLLHQIFSASQNKVMAYQNENNVDTKTTMSILIIKDRLASAGHIGDSRIYHFSDDKVAFRTLDDSVPEMLVQAGKLKENDIRHHDDRNRLLRVIGTEWNKPANYTIDIIDMKINNGDKFLLCTDGFWEWITEDQMIRLYIKECNSPKEWLDKMENIIKAKAAANNKRMDNYSAIAVWIEAD